VNHPFTCILGIDAMNIRDGGGLTHLREILYHATRETILFDRVIVWGNEVCLQELPDQPWLTKINPLPHKSSGIRTTLWQIFSLGNAARKMNCSLLFIAGGSALTRFQPKVTICHNMLPFTDAALQLYPTGIRKLKFYLLRFIQLHTFRRAKGIIFLSQWAKDSLLSKMGKTNQQLAVIPHGVNAGFSFPDRVHRRIEDCSSNEPFTLIYVSRIESYKNQLQVIEAFHQLQIQYGWPLKLQLAGLASDKEYDQLVKKKITTVDPSGAFIEYLGAVPYAKLGTYYRQADLGVFASSCENMPIILLEKMASGLPLICNDAPPMHDFLLDGGVYINFNDISKMTQTMKDLISDTSERTRYSKIGIESSSHYDWKISSKNTFQYLFDNKKMQL
jgi:glycosyltransferase involved in cell wall biosynthesis